GRQLRSKGTGGVRARDHRHPLLVALVHARVSAMSSRPSGRYTISTDPSRFDLDMIHAFLTTSYWARGISRELVKRSIGNALCFGVFDRDRHVGFARVITDRATTAHIGDVFVLETHRGRGLSKLLLKTILEHPDLQGLRRWSLATDDAHGLYRQFGFTPLEHPERHMERVNRDVYQR